MSSVSAELVRELLTESLTTWRVAGRVSRQGNAVVISQGRTDVRVEPADAGSMFRWTVTIGKRRRAAISLVAVLRRVREALDPGYTANRVRIAVASLVPS